MSQLETPLVHARLLPTGGLLDVPGFQAQGVHCGLRYKQRDLAIIVSQHPASTAAVFTRNAFAAAPVHVSREHLAQGEIQAIVCNSANANACTGPQGMADARAMAGKTAHALGLELHQVLVASTGIIGHPLDMGKVNRGIEQCAGKLDQATGGEAAEAITTTDSHTKQVAAIAQAGERAFHLGAIAKGSGMIHPNMGTMLCFVATDAPIGSEHLQPLLQETVDASFNQISVDGDESTNDMVAVLANGAAGGPPIEPGSPAYEAFADALGQVCKHLARMIAADGEGATKLIEVQVTGAASVEEARAAARAVASSNLVKAAIHGEDPNWGRVLAAIGATGAQLDPGGVSLRFHHGPHQLKILTQGQPLLNGGPPEGLEALQGDQVTINVDLAVGDEGAEAWGCDLTQEYVQFNSAYST